MYLKSQLHRFVVTSAQFQKDVNVYFCMREQLKYYVKLGTIIYGQSCPEFLFGGYSIMKITKILSAVAASVVAAGALAASASAYTATLGFADGSWTAQDWATSTEVNGDGTYSITSVCQMENEDTAEMENVAGAGITVFVVDIAGLGADLGIDGTDEVAKYDTGDLVISDVTVSSGSTTFAVDNSKIKVGDIEGKGNVRIEIYNAYGPTTVDQSYDASVSPIDPSTFAFEADDQLTVTFTVSGLGGGEAAETPAETPADDTASAPTTGKDSPETGVEGIAAVAGVAVLAAGAVLVSRKRK